MGEWMLIAAIALAASSGVPGLFLHQRGRAGEGIFAGVITVSAVLACVGAATALAGGGSEGLSAPWPVPGGSLAVRVDAVAAVFILPIAVIPALGAWYGIEYWSQKNHPATGRKVRAFYGTVVAGMLLLVIANNAVLFLAGWEIMAASAFMLVSAEDVDRVVRHAGLVYILATRLGTLCLFAMFALLGASSGTLDFEGWPRALASPFAGAIFVLGLVGFGLKAGLVPLHVWLPGAHAAAPSHVSALMSGVLIKTGIYGLVRLTASCAMPPAWWGYTLLAAGVISGVLGVAFAIGQHDVKRLLAYHSVENVGIICLGLGVAVVGRSLGRPELITLGVAGAVLHVWNHGLFKSLLFLSAGSLVRATGTREIDRLGGLWRRMPWTGAAFLLGAVAITGLPPLNGLISEFLVFLGLFHTGPLGGGPWLASSLAAAALAMIGALALACFVKVFGTIFLGNARTSDVERAAEAGPAMLAPMAILAGACAFIGLGAPLLGPVLDRATAGWAGGAAIPPLAAYAPLGRVAGVHAALLLAVAALASRLAVRARAHPATVAIGTWDCGYAAPSSRMQYTSSSFARGIVELLAWALRPRVHAPHLLAPFPSRAEFHSQVPDVVLESAILPAFSLAGGLAGRLRPIQLGSVHLYILYILGALFALLLWS